MKIGLKDTIIIDWADKIRKCRLANGLDNINHSKDTIKVIMENDNSYNPITINKKDIVEIIKGENNG